MNADVNKYKESIDKLTIYDKIDSTNQAKQTVLNADNLSNFDIGSVSHPYLRDIYSRLKEKYYNEDYADSKMSILSDCLNGLCLLPKSFRTNTMKATSCCGKIPMITKLWIKWKAQSIGAPSLRKRLEKSKR